MRNVILGSIVLSGAAITAFALWRPTGDSEQVGTSAVMTAPRPAPAIEPSAPRPAAQSPAVAAAARQPDSKREPEPEEIAADAAHDDGEDHNHEQVDPQPLEIPPPSREAFGADPASEVAALAEARSILEQLLEDPDPAVHAEVTALLEAIEAAN